MNESEEVIEINEETGKTPVCNEIIGNVRIRISFCKDSKITEFSLISSTILSSISIYVTIEEIIRIAGQSITFAIPHENIVAIFTTSKKKKEEELEGENEDTEFDQEEESPKVVCFGKFRDTKICDIFTDSHQISTIDVLLRPLSVFDEIQSFDRSKLNHIQTKEMIFEELEKIGYPSHVLEIAYSEFKTDLERAKKYFEENGKLASISKLEELRRKEAKNLKEKTSKMETKTYLICPEIPIPKDKGDEFSAKLLDLGQDMIFLIFEYSDFCSIMSFSITCKLMYLIITHKPFVWNIVMSKLPIIIQDQFIEFLVLKNCITLKRGILENEGASCDEMDVDSEDSDYETKTIPVPFLQKKLKSQLYNMVNLGNSDIKSIVQWEEDLRKNDSSSTSSSCSSILNSSSEEEKINYFSSGGRRFANTSEMLGFKRRRRRKKKLKSRDKHNYSFEKSRKRNEDENYLNKCVFSKVFLEEIVGGDYLPGINFKKFFADLQKTKHKQALIPHIQSEKSRLHYADYDRWSRKGIFSVFGCFIICLLCVFCILIFLVPLFLGNIIPSPFFDDTGSFEYFRWTNYFCIVPFVLLDCCVFPCFFMLYIKNCLASDFYPLFFFCKRTSTYFGNDRFARNSAPNYYDDVGFDLLTLVLTPLLWIPIFVNLLFGKFLILPGTFGRITWNSLEDYSWIPGLFPYTYFMILPVLPCMVYGYISFVCTGLSVFWNDKIYFRFMVCSSVGLFIINFMIIIPILVIFGFQCDGIFDSIAISIHESLFLMSTEYFQFPYFLICLLIKVILIVFCCQFIIPFCMSGKCKKNILDCCLECYLPCFCPSKILCCLISPFCCTFCCFAFFGSIPLVVKYVPVIFLISMVPVYVFVSFVCCILCCFSCCFACGACVVSLIF